MVGSSVDQPVLTAGELPLRMRFSRDPSPAGRVMHIRAVADHQPVMRLACIT
jgi:hypothetical protein